MVGRFQIKEAAMNCVICKTGQISAGTAVVTLQRGETTVVIKNVPADVCDNCGEYYLSDEMAERVLELGESAVKKGVEVEVMRWAA
jgi:YgiT-type zinc finger domain-containing protein